MGAASWSGVAVSLAWQSGATYLGRQPQVDVSTRCNLGKLPSNISEESRGMPTPRALPCAAGET